MASGLVAKVEQMTQLRGTTFALLKLLASYSHLDGTHIYPSIATLSVRLGVSIRTVYRHIAILEGREAAIRCVDRPDGNPGWCCELILSQLNAAPRKHCRPRVNIRQKSGDKMANAIDKRIKNAESRTKPPTPSRKREREKQGGMEKRFPAVEKNNRPRSANHRPGPTLAMLEAWERYNTEMKREGRCTYVKNQATFFREGWWSHWPDLLKDPGYYYARTRRPAAVAAASPAPASPPPFPAPADDGEEKAARQAAQKPWQLVMSRLETTLGRKRWRDLVQCCRAVSLVDGVLLLRSPDGKFSELLDRPWFPDALLGTGIERIRIFEEARHG